MQHRQPQKHRTEIHQHHSKQTLPRKSKTGRISNRRTLHLHRSNEQAKVDTTRRSREEERINTESKCDIIFDH